MQYVKDPTGFKVENILIEKCNKTNCQLMNLYLFELMIMMLGMKIPCLCTQFSPLNLTLIYYTQKEVRFP